MINYNLIINLVNQNIMQSNRIRTAATSGLLLALVTIISVLVQFALEPGKTINLIIWTIKSVGSIWLLYYFIKEYAKPSNLFTYKDGFRYGFLIALFSSIVCAAYMFFHYAILFPDSTAAQIDLISEMMASSNPEAVETFERISPLLPQIIFITILIYYTIIGAIASAIIANYTKKGSIFDEPINL